MGPCLSLEACHPPAPLRLCQSLHSASSPPAWDGLQLHAEAHAENEVSDTELEGHSFSTRGSVSVWIVQRNMLDSSA